jgi:phenylacetate-CoA ligase
MLSSYDMTEENMLEYRNKINKHRPQLITGYGSALYLFSSFLKEKKLDIYTPKGIISSAETLYEHQRERIESVFGCKVFNRYGCREVGNIAQECSEQSGLHMNSEHILVEVLDEDGLPCEPGKTGEIVVTDLDNYAFPFIRYRIEDIGTLSSIACPCGRGLPMLEKVEGRIWDIIVGTNGNRLVGTFWLIEGIKGVKRFQIIQERFGELLVKLVVNSSFTQREKQILVDRVHRKCGQDMKIEIQIVDKIPLTKSGKHRFIISKVSPFV